MMTDATTLRLAARLGAMGARIFLVPGAPRGDRYVSMIVGATAVYVPVGLASADLNWQLVESITDVTFAIRVRPRRRRRVAPRAKHPTWFLWERESWRQAQDIKRACPWELLLPLWTVERLRDWEVAERLSRPAENVRRALLYWIELGKLPANPGPHDGP